jgi:hypothetical protein
MHHLWAMLPGVKRGGEKPRGSVWGGDATPLRHHPAARPRPEDLERAVCAKLGIAPEALRRVHMVRRGNDARKKSAIKLVYVLDVEVEDEARILTGFAEDQHVRATPDTSYHFPVMAPADYSGPRPVVIGAGPCGLLAALILAQMGLKPIIIERGKAVRERTKDTWGLWRRSELNPESNVQFGEGGAGTFSDGKLYSRIKDPRHLGRKVLVEFVKAGAPDDILYEAHPHIGTFRLVTMVMSMRDTIEKLGGEYRFSTRVSGFDIAGEGRTASCAACIWPMAVTSKPAMSSWPWAIPPATPSRRCMRRASPWRPSPSPSACASSIRKAGSIRPASAPARAMKSSARRPIRCLTSARTGARSIRSACAPVGAWSPPPARRAASSPTA